MKKCDLKLKELIDETVMPDIEDSIDEIYEQIAKDKSASEELNKELEQLHEMRSEFQEILKDIDERKLDKEECQELYEGIVSMLEGDFEDDDEFDDEEDIDLKDFK